MKIDVSEILDAQQVLNNSRNQLQSQIEQAKTALGVIITSDGLSGNVKTAINGDIANHQLPLLTNYYDVIFYLTDEFGKLIKNFQSTVHENSSSAKIDTEALSTMEGKFATQAEGITKAANKANGAYSKIDDLVSVSKVNTEDFTKQLNQAKKVLTNTRTWMDSFNQQRASTKVADLLTQQKSELGTLGSIGKYGYTSSESLAILSMIDFKGKINDQHKTVVKKEKLAFKAEHPVLGMMDGSMTNASIGNITNTMNEYNKLKDDISDNEWFKRTKNLASMLTSGVTKNAFYKFGKSGEATNTLLMADWNNIKKFLRAKDSKVAEKMLQAMGGSFNRMLSQTVYKLKGINKYAKPFSETVKWVNDTGGTLLKKGSKYLSESKIVGPLAKKAGWFTMGVTATISGYEAYQDKDGKAYHDVGKAAVHAGVDTLKNTGPIEGALIGARAGLWGAAGGFVLGSGNMIWGVVSPKSKDWVYGKIEEGGDWVVDRLDDTGKSVGKATKSAWSSITSFLKGGKPAYG
ncbi:MAG: hypothetical protein H9W82_16365 [Lactobacillus sp.]|nr:hypothetical protein [Lactobacillus sp.]